MGGTVICGKCRAEFKVRDELLGKTVTCTRCKSPIQIPKSVAGALPPSPPLMPARPVPQQSTAPPRAVPSGGMQPGGLRSAAVVDFAKLGAQNEPFVVTETVEGAQSTVEILEYNKLTGCHSLESAMALYFASSQNMALRQARITLRGSRCQLQAGLLQFLRGNIEIETDVKGVGGFLNGMVKGAVTGESAVKPYYTGAGQIYLEPTFGQLVVLKLENEEAHIADRMFYAVEGGVSLETTQVGTVATGLFGGQGFFINKLIGTGWVVLALPVPSNEIMRYTLHGPDDVLKVDGGFGLLRRGNVSFTTERSTKTLIGSAASGEGLLQVYRGTGEVWVASTMDTYDSLLQGGLSRAQGTSGENANNNAAGAISGFGSLLSAFSE